MSQKSMNTSALLAHAVKVERDGYRFYIHLAKEMSEKKLMDLFHQFAEDELRHEMSFKKMMEAVKPGAGEESTSQKSLLKRFLVDMDRYGVEKVESVLKGKSQRNELIDIAIQLEKDSIIYYSSLKKQFKIERETVLEEIIDEEFRHLSRLLAIRQGDVDIGNIEIDDI